MSEQSPIISSESINSSRLPITSNDITELIESNIENNSTKELINIILKDLMEKSSRFKYIITANLINAIADSDNQINSSFGSLWDDKNDGLLTVKYKVDDSTWLVLTIFFVTSF